MGRPWPHPDRISAPPSPTTAPPPRLPPTRGPLLPTRQSGGGAATGRRLAILVLHPRGIDAKQPGDWEQGRDPLLSRPAQIYRRPGPLLSRPARERSARRPRRTLTQRRPFGAAGPQLGAWPRSGARLARRRSRAAVDGGGAPPLLGNIGVLVACCGGFIAGGRCLTWRARRRQDAEEFSGTSLTVGIGGHGPCGRCGVPGRRRPARRPPRRRGPSPSRAAAAMVRDRRRGFDTEG